MPLLPDPHAARIAFFKNRIALWDSNAVPIGTTTAAVTALGAAAAAAAAALAAQETARDAAKAATLDLRLAVRNMTNQGMAIVEQVRTKSRSAGDGVYALANLPAPALPAPKGDPGTPYDFKAELYQDGTLGLTFKCDNPAGGTIYQVYRRSAAGAEFAYVGGNGARKFVDTAIPPGVTQLTYQVQAVRSTAVGNFAQFNVNFGTATGGVATASIAETPMKLAA